MKTVHKRSLLLLGLLILGLIMIACGGGDGGGPSVPKVYTVSGTIVDVDDQPISDVTVKFSDPFGETMTNKEGLWSKDGLTGRVTVTPEHKDYTFDPAYVPVTKAVTNVDFIGTKAAPSLQLQANETEVEDGQDVTLVATISGEETAGVTIDWSARADDGTPAGMFHNDTSASGESVIWKAPTEAGAYTITATATVEGKTITANVVITVNLVPLTVAIDTVSLRTTLGGTPIPLTAVVTGSNANNATIKWTASAGTFTKHTDAQVDWHPPFEPGIHPDTYIIEVEAVAGVETAVAEIETETVLCNSGSPTSEGTPCIISNVIQLQAMGEHLTGHFALGNNIDASPTRMWPGGFTPVGTKNTAFSGTFDGRNYEITDLFINLPFTEYVGLFGQTRGATIENITLRDVDVKGDWRVGAAIGWAEATAVTNVHSSGEVAGNPAASGNNVGGIAGGIIRASSVIEDSSSAAQVSGAEHVGGLVGYNDQLIERSFSTGTVSGYGKVGGLVGVMTLTGEIENSYSWSEVDAPGGTGVGGLVGHMLHNFAVIKYSYSKGRVTGGSENVGGLVGNNVGDVRNSYWDTGTSGIGDPGMGEGRSTRRMIMQETYEGWDFDQVWTMNVRGYPDLITNPRL